MLITYITELSSSYFSQPTGIHLLQVHENVNFKSNEKMKQQLFYLAVVPKYILSSMEWSRKLINIKTEEECTVLYGEQEKAELAIFYLFSLLFGQYGTISNRVVQLPLLGQSHKKINLSLEFYFSSLTVATTSISNCIPNSKQCHFEPVFTVLFKKNNSQEPKNSQTEVFNYWQKLYCKRKKYDIFNESSMSTHQITAIAGKSLDDLLAVREKNEYLVHGYMRQLRIQYSFLNAIILLFYGI